MKKKVFVTCCAWLSAMSAMYADTYPYLLFRKTDGTVLSVAASGVEMTVAGGNLVVNDGCSTQQISLSDLKSMCFSTGDATEIRDATSSDGCEASGMVSVYTMAGVHVGDYDSLDAFTSGAASGVYVVKSGSRTYKTVVR